MRINHNIAALNTYSRLSLATDAQAKTLEKLSSGIRLNKAGDDAAGLAISEKMRAQIKGLQEGQNTQNAVTSLDETALQNENSGNWESSGQGFKIENSDGDSILISTRTKLAAYQSRLESTMKNLDMSPENLTAAESRIRDSDMAKEMMEFTKGNILNQASTAMLAQANQGSQGVLQLLR